MNLVAIPRDWRPLEPGVAPRRRVVACAVPGCDRPHEARGMCHGHYAPWSSNRANRRRYVVERAALFERVRREYGEAPRAPATRGECEDHARWPRPCPAVRCRYHLSVAAEPESCALDVAAAGARSQRDIGVLIGTSHERVRQIEVRALRKLRARLWGMGLRYRDLVPPDAPERDEGDPPCKSGDWTFSLAAAVTAAYRRIVPESARRDAQRARGIREGIFGDRN